MLVAPRISEYFDLLQSTLDLVCYSLPWTWSAIDASHLTSSFADFGVSGDFGGFGDFSDFGDFGDFGDLSDFGDFGDFGYFFW